MEKLKGVCELDSSCRVLDEKTKKESNLPLDMVAVETPVSVNNTKKEKKKTEKKKRKKRNETQQKNNTKKKKKKK